MHVFFAFFFIVFPPKMQANVPEIRSFDDAIVMLSSANQSENTTVSTLCVLCLFICGCVVYMRVNTLSIITTTELEIYFST